MSLDKGTVVKGDVKYNGEVIIYVIKGMDCR